MLRQIGTRLLSSSLPSPPPFSYWVILRNTKDVYFESWGFSRRPGSTASPLFSENPAVDLTTQPVVKKEATKLDEIKSLSAEILETGASLAGSVADRVKSLADEKNTGENRAAVQNQFQDLVKLNLTTARDCLREFILGYKEAKATEFQADDLTVEEVYEKAMRKMSEVKDGIEESVSIIRDEKKQFDVSRKESRKDVKEEDMSIPEQVYDRVNQKIAEVESSVAILQNEKASLDASLESKSTADMSVPEKVYEKVAKKMAEVEESVGIIKDELKSKPTK